MSSSDPLKTANPLSALFRITKCASNLGFATNKWRHIVLCRSRSFHDFFSFAELYKETRFLTKKSENVSWSRSRGRFALLTYNHLSYNGVSLCNESKSEIIDFELEIDSRVVRRFSYSQMPSATIPKRSEPSHTDQVRFSRLLTKQISLQVLEQFWNFL